MEEPLREVCVRVCVCKCADVIVAEFLYLYVSIFKGENYSNLLKHPPTPTLTNTPISLLDIFFPKCTLYCYNMQCALHKCIL